MKVHGNHTVNTGCSQHIGHKFGGNRNTGLVLAVLTRPAEVRHYGYHGLGRSAFCRINHQEELHEVVAVGESALYEIDLAAAHRFLERYFKFTVGEMFDFHRAELYTEFFTDFLGHVARLSARKNLERGKG